jgi:hypothetical protein
LDSGVVGALSERRYVISTICKNTVDVSVVWGEHVIVLLGDEAQRARVFIN